MTDLDTLRPEVQAAMRTMNGQAGGNRDDAYDVIEAELLRLAAENASMRAAWHDALLTETGILRVERIDPATAMLPVEPQQEPTK